MRSWSLPGMHLLVTSRDEVDIRNRLKPTVDEEQSMRNHAIDQDISKFISAELRTNPDLYKWEAHRDTIQKALTERAGGVFRWVECQFQSLKSCQRSERKLISCLEGLPRDLDETYERMLCKIDECSVKEARRMLTLLCYSARPLTVPELIDGIAVNLDEPAHLDHRCRLEDSDDLYELCPGLIRITPPDDDREQTVHLAHFSVQEYLQSDRIRRQKSEFALQYGPAHTEISHICFIYLREPDLSNGILDQRKLKEFPLARYAARFWYDHYSNVEEKPDYLEEAILRLFGRQREGFITWARLYEHDYYNDISPLNKVGPPVYYASLLGMLQLLQDIIAEESTNSVVVKGIINAQGGKYGTALGAASNEGFTAISQFLLDNGADVNLTDGWGESALTFASRRGHEDVVQLLLNNGADINAQGRRYGTALQAASYRGYKGVVQLLLDRGADINTQCGNFGTALQAASIEGYKDVVQLLLDRGADVNTQCGYFSTPLQAASKWGHIDVVQLLLDNGADISIQGGPALQVASTEGRESLVRLLLDNGADINAQGKGHSTALREASAWGHEGVVRLLLDRGADINAQGSFGTALHAASIRGQKGVAQLLLDRGANIDAQKVGYSTALQAASTWGHKGLVQLLLDRGADINTQKGGYSTPLQAASRGGHEGVVRFLLDRGADVNARGPYNTALQAASAGGHEGVIRLLRDRGAYDIS
ncbi:hypothetical protein FQN49_008257 [Arthroderma sp. PD_2]|nr:hypothetical protein FQN49_008257 [Arthroderma sp. PD_2]